MLGTSKIAEGEHGDTGLDIQSAHPFRRQQRNLCKIFRGRIDVDRCIGNEDRLIFEDHHIQPGNLLYPILRTDDLDRRPYRFRIGLRKARNQPIGITLAHHHHAENIPRPHLPFGVSLRYSLPLAQLI